MIMRYVLFDFKNLTAFSLSMLHHAMIPCCGPTISSGPLLFDLFVSLLGLSFSALDRTSGFLCDDVVISILPNSSSS